MKCLLIVPPTGLYVREDRCQRPVKSCTVPVRRPPTDLMFMAATLESIGIECIIRDYPVEDTGVTFEEDFRRLSPDYLVLSITTSTLNEDMKTCRLAKSMKPEILTIAKGAHFLLYDIEALETFKDLDVAIRGECELVIGDIVRTKDLHGVKGITFRNGKDICRNEPRPLIEDLDLLPFPARHLVNNARYTRPDTGKPLALIEASRGCPALCIYCLTAQVAGYKIRTRSKELIADEMEQCINKYNIHNFGFKADTFTWKKDWVIGVCKEIVARKLKVEWYSNSRVDTLDEDRIEWMKKAGCYAVGLGIESGSQETLNKIKKGTTLEQARKAVKLCKTFGIKTYMYFMIGFPWEAKEHIQQTLDFALELDGDFVDFLIAYPFSGTELEEMVKGSVLDNHVAIEDCDAYAQALVGTQYLSAEELTSCRKTALRTFYTRPRYIARQILQAKSPTVIYNYIKYGVRALSKA